MAERKLTVACAESCTGGLVTSRLTDIDGSSRYVRGGVVAYATDTKRDVLGVSADILRKVGAIAAETAFAMADGVRRAMGSDIGVGVTGNVGTVGDENKPVGLVYVALTAKDFRRVEAFRFAGTRREKKQQAADAALQMICEYAEGDKS